MNRPMLLSESQTASPGQDSATRKQIRGSTLLLTGRCVALLINLAVQVIAVRYLAKETFGAFAFGPTEAVCDRFCGTPTIRNAR